MAVKQVSMRRSRPYIPIRIMYLYNTCGTRICNNKILVFIIYTIRHTYIMRYLTRNTSKFVFLILFGIWHLALCHGDTEFNDYDYCAVGSIGKWRA